ncbi:hypothetical protein AYL99_00606 [Fonsecaea erecta]|uniref:Uncharacterized protein n=1 Tax=Fonsecaea erecta TaxID=1367422 RepID=A0A178ZXV6_9EURO|nr:hypothetical protein AYL99_00606 [Fonsecaea erecta]OAP64634.1 hypothetical protein AYL99_00606 [Fonsecaea erecta]
MATTVVTAGGPPCMSYICPSQGDTDFLAGTTECTLIINTKPAECVDTATATGTIASRTTASRFSSPQANGPATASSSVANLTTAGPLVGHPHEGGHAHPHAVIAVPLTVGIIIFLLTAILLWRRYRPSSFHKILDSIPGCGCFARWRKTREKNRETLALHRLGILTGDGHRMGGTGLVAGDTYARHLRKFEEDAVRAKGKCSYDTNAQSPGSPFSTGKRSAKSGGTPRNLQLGSPWKYTPTKVAGNSGRGPRDSLESWEETWYAMGTTDGAAAKGEQEEGVTAGSGQSWRKLV